MFVSDVNITPPVPLDVTQTPPPRSPDEAHGIVVGSPPVIVSPCKVTVKRSLVVLSIRNTLSIEGALIMVFDGLSGRVLVAQLVAAQPPSILIVWSLVGVAV